MSDWLSRLMAGNMGADSTPSYGRARARAATGAGAGPAAATGAAAVAVLLMMSGCAADKSTIQAAAKQRWDKYRATVKYDLANEVLRGGDAEKAITLAREAAGLSPDQPEYAALLAKGYISRGDFSAARKVLELSQRVYANQGELQYLMGIVLERDRDWDRAVKAYGAAAAADPANLEYRIAYAQALSRSRSDPPAAIDALAARSESFDFEPPFHRALAELKLAAGDVSGACEAFRRAMQLGADDRDIRASTALCLYRLGRFAEARELLAPMVDALTDSTSPLLLPYARCLMETGALDAARTKLEQFTRAHPADAAAWSLLAQARAARGSIEPALEAVNRSAALQPGSGDVQLLRSALSALSGRPSEAVEIACHAIETDPQNSDAYVLLGFISEQSNDAETAADMYRLALRIDPEHELASTRLKDLDK